MTAFVRTESNRIGLPPEEIPTSRREIAVDADASTGMLTDTFSRDLTETVDAGTWIVTVAVDEAAVVPCWVDAVPVAEGWNTSTGVMTSTSASSSG